MLDKFVFVKQKCQTINAFNFLNVLIWIYACNFFGFSSHRAFEDEAVTNNDLNSAIVLMIMQISPEPKLSSSNCFFCPNQRSKTERLVFNCHKWQREAGNLHISDAGTRQCFTFLLKNIKSIIFFLSINQLSLAACRRPAGLWEEKIRRTSLSLN